MNKNYNLMEYGFPQELKNLMVQKGIFKDSVISANQLKVMDSLAPMLPSSVAMASPILTRISTEIVETILQKRTAEEVIGSKKKLLDWEEDTLTIPMIETTGQTTPYGDFVAAKRADTAITFNTFKHYRFMSGFEIGDLMAQQASRANIDLTKINMKGAINALLIEENNTAFYGYLPNSNGEYLVRGLFSNTAIDPYILLPVSLTTMIAANDWEGVLKFFVDGVTEIALKSGSHITNKTRFRVSFPTEIYNALNLPRTQLDQGVIAMIQRTYPNLEIIDCPEMANAYAGDNVSYFVAELDEEYGGVYETMTMSYSEQMKSSAIVINHNSRSQQLHCGMTDVIIYKPYLVSRYAGV